MKVKFLGAFFGLGLLALIFLGMQSDAETPSGIETHLDLDYYTGPDADSEKHKLDLYLPDNKAEAPILLWIHGGAWVTGGRKQEAGLAKHLVAKGIGVAVMSYRLSDGRWMNPNFTGSAKHPDHIQDCVRALAWLKQQAKEYGYDTDKLFVGGYSAGGHLSALMCMDEQYLKTEDLSFADVRGAVPMAGAYDMVAYYQSHVEGNGKEMADSHVLGVFGELEDVKKASPTEYIDAAVIPMLVVSETDTYDYTKLLEDRVGDKPHIEFYHVRDKNHAALYLDMAKNGDSKHTQKLADYLLRVSTEEKVK
ncbi:MAG: alpha/beta hydrolase [Saprospiraceae bacterium]|nr:alpha/beta hydrolase [Saprospiraceae bacterium]